jgi:hypothetical protein
MNGEHLPLARAQRAVALQEPLYQQAALEWLIPLSGDLLAVRDPPSDANTTGKRELGVKTSIENNNTRALNNKTYAGDSPDHKSSLLRSVGIHTNI